MCGIIGRVAFEANLSIGQAVAEVAAMNATVKHRGPDDEGLRVSEDAILGNQRLSVVDLERGHQPMEFATSLGSVALTYNGEVYNAPELRRELETNGHVFQSNSDTEVVLHGYLQWGEGVAEKLRGMFAFGVWDGRESQRKLIMARDPMGTKPLHYYPTQDGVLFGSEAKAILAHPLAKPAVGIAGWRELFTASKTPGSVIWDGMKEVRPGSIVTVDEDGTHERPPYWRLHSNEHPDNYSGTVERVREHLERIIHEQLVADVPVGVLLSGGVDSSAITALAARERGSLASYVVDYTDHERFLNNADVIQRGYDTPFAQEVATRWNTDHTVVELDPRQLASAGLREKIVRARDHAMGIGDHDSSHLLLFEKIRERCAVALSGENADELFGGYPIFSNSKVLGGHGWSWALFNPEEYAEQLAILNPEFRDVLELDAYGADTYATAASEVERTPGESALDHRRREINYLETTRHIGYLQDYTDRLSAANSLEVRVPFCDQELVEYVYNVPWSMKASDGRVKGLLKDAVRDLLPSSVLERTKSAYPFVPHPVYLQEIQRQGKELAPQQHSVFDIISRERLVKAVTKPVDQMKWTDRYAINLALEMALWIDLYKPSMTTS